MLDLFRKSNFLRKHHLISCISVKRYRFPKLPSLIYTREEWYWLLKNKKIKGKREILFIWLFKEDYFLGRKKLKCIDDGRFPSWNQSNRASNFTKATSLTGTRWFSRWFLYEYNVLYFFINNEILLKPKKRPNYTGCIQLGTNTVTHKLQASIKALTKTIEWLPKTVIQSKSLWKKSFRSHPVLSVSSKLRLFLSCQIDHIKQWGTAFLVKLLWWSPNFPSQQANSSTTVFGIIEWTPNKANTKVYNSTAIQQWRERWSTDSPLLLHRTNPI